jgi:hypothetical protein
MSMPNTRLKRCARSSSKPSIRPECCRRGRRAPRPPPGLGRPLQTRAACQGIRSYFAVIQLAICATTSRSMPLKP